MTALFGGLCIFVASICGFFCGSAFQKKSYLCALIEGALALSNVYWLWLFESFS